MPDAKDQDPARDDEEIYPMVAVGVLPEFACTHAWMYIYVVFNSQGGLRLCRHKAGLYG